MTDINKIKNAVRMLAGLAESNIDFADDEWSIDYHLDLDKELRDELAKLQIELDLLTNALKEKDLVTAKYALVMARLFSLNLSNFFLNIFEDIEKVGWSEEIKLPAIPEDYQIPEHYNYPKK
ncbi:hypothetical protein EHN07_16945 [Buttiauxella warmboldiae]|uniref:Uncharacterized protein n=1 Tax=Buttiauxella warmboldiae TaxID=82993 RepID=A0A3N5D7B8_9ENTR|nr:hypothetical protein [Buttiauxella warmboldiae]RPH22321.1 hypothetical protein EHN07_16945 [Buttiauxella warmboldiae]